MIHPSQHAEARNAALSLGLLGSLMLCALLLPAPAESKGFANYLPLHMTLEVMAVSIAGLVFAIGWNTQQYHPSRNVHWLACLFLGVAWLDLTHMLSYSGMPDFVTPASPQKAINFWLAARSLAALALIGAILIPRGQTPRLPRHVLLIGVLMAVAAVHLLFLYHPEHVPETFIPGQGLTPFKIGFEYALIAAYLVAGALYFRQLRRPRTFNASGLMAAAVVMAMSEFFFTLYANVTDVYNLLGHVYKIVAYGFLYRALFVETVQLPYRRLSESQRQLSATINALPDLLFEIDAGGTYLDVHTNEHGKLAAPASALVGKHLRDVMPEAEANEALRALRTAGEHGASHGTRITLNVPEGQRVFELSVARKEVAPGGEAQFLVLSRDVTEAVEHEQALVHEAEINAELLKLPEIAQTSDEASFLQHAVECLQRLTGSELAYIHILLAGQDHIAQAICSASTVATLGVGALDTQSPMTKDGHWAEAFHQRQPVVFNDPLDLSEQPLSPEPASLQRSIHVPVMEGAQVRMMLGVGSKPSRYTERDVKTLQILGESIWQITNRHRQERDLRQKQEEIDYFFSANLDLFAIGKLDGEILRANSAWEQATGYPVALIEGRNFMDFVHPDDRQATLAAIASLKSQQGVLDFENRWLSRDGSPRYFEWRAKTNGDLVYASARDITLRKQQDASIHKLSSALEQSPYTVLITDAAGRIEYANAAFTHSSGYALKDVLGKNPNMLQSGKTPAATYRAMWSKLQQGEAWHGELINRRKDGSECTESVLVYPVRDEHGTVVNYLAHKEDITEKKAAAERIQQLSHYDQLTGLPNRSLLQERAAHALALAHKHHEPLTLMYLDLDNFKTINEGLGQGVGDLLLREVAQRLRAQLRDEDTLSRQSGDDFTVVLPGTDQDSAAALATRLLSTLEQPINLSDQELIVSGSLGIALYPSDGDTLDVLQTSAESAMYRVKQEGRNGFRFYAPEMQAHTARTLALSTALKHALPRGELHLVYQPQCSLTTNQIVGAEVLLRWRHPQLGLVPPSEFIPLAEANGLIVPIGEWVLLTAAQQLKRWQDVGLRDLIIAVNLSAVQFARPTLASTISKLVSEAGVSPQNMELELTEAVALMNPEAASETMADLSRAGFRLSIDDFGTGYSSMSYLKRFAVDKLKIDQSFVRELHTNADDQAIVTAIIQMARSLGMTTIAEGVETSEQRYFLSAHGCDEIQGYFYSRPLDPEVFETFVRERQRS
ncbi:EAL domain-containing protein [Aquabacterium sp.]|uniref:EAL domain-containing protein n=1 Tax=Aquabacterium sp. TaxID=1872578 RepID=UPI003BAFA744